MKVKTFETAVTYSDIRPVSVPDVAGPGAWFTVCLKVVEDLQDPVHGARRPFQSPGGPAGTQAGATGHPRAGLDPTATDGRVIVVGLQVGR